MRVLRSPAVVSSYLGLAQRMQAIENAVRNTCDLRVTAIVWKNTIPPSPLLQ
jgi:hypothetical protein